MRRRGLMSPYPDLAVHWAMNEQIPPWFLSSYATRWYEDAQKEARSLYGTAEEKRDALRREIIFAVCFLESYLFESVRNVLLEADASTTLGSGFARLNEIFPLGDRRGIGQRWKQVCKALYDDGYLIQQPEFNNATWSDFNALVTWRDGLVHARASRPQTAGQSKDEMPVPRPEDLEKQEPGFAVQSAYNLYEQLLNWLRPEYRNPYLKPPRDSG